MCSLNSVLLSVDNPTDEYVGLRNSYSETSNKLANITECVKFVVCYSILTRAVYVNIFNWGTIITYLNFK